MEKKYELIPSDKEGLYRIKALRSFYFIKEGTVGGYVASEDNLSHEGNCWIHNNAIVCEEALVEDNAQIYDSAVISGYATVCDNTLVYNEAKVFGDARVWDNARVFHFARLYGDAVACGTAQIGGYSSVFDYAGVKGNARVMGTCVVGGHADILDNVCLYGDAVVKSMRDYIVFKNWWSSGRFFTWTRSNNMWDVGCFHGTGKELVEKAYKDSEESGREYERIVKYVEEIIKQEKQNGTEETTSV